MSKRSFISSLLVLVGLVAACGGTSDLDDVAPTADLDGTDELGSVTNCNVDGCWTGSAIEPLYDGGMELRARAVFSGPADKTRRMGVCLLQRYGSGVNCTQASDCANAPTTLPSGGSRYCAAVEGSTQKQCYYRPGTNVNYCAGSPALPCVSTITGQACTCGTSNCAPPPVAPGEYTSPVRTVSAGTYISYACFESCAASDPATSSVQHIVYSGGTPSGSGPCDNKIFGCTEN